MDATARADELVAQRLRLAAAREPVPGTPAGTSAADLAASISRGSPHAERFRIEIACAVGGTALALAAARTHPAKVWPHARAHHPDPTVWFEQAVVLGHPTHPLARTRGHLTADQIRAWAPEHRPRFDLGLYRRTDLAAGDDWDPPGHLPVHPWQAERHRLGPPQRVWPGAAPLMSLRTISTGDLHVKCAVDLQLTSAIRRVSAAAAHNGPLLSRILAAPARAAGLILMPERSAIATGPAGPDPALAAIIRPAPHTLAGPHVLPFAALAEPCPDTGRPIAAAIAGDRIDQWWRDLVDVAFAPLRLYAATGVALEAHGQNLLIAFDGDRPHRCLYRDFGGIRLPATGWPALPGSIQTDEEDERIRKLLAALLPTTMTALVDRLADWTGTDPDRWWATVADTARTLPPGPLTDALLHRPWPVKATTAMRLADDPTADIWTAVPNPLART